jgi:hypothetical protein
MNDLFTSGSFKKYADLKQQVVMGDLESGAADERPDLDRFFEDVEAVKEDLRGMEALYRRLQAAHEESKTARARTPTSTWCSAAPRPSRASWRRSTASTPPAAGSPGAGLGRPLIARAPPSSPASGRSSRTS